MTKEGYTHIIVPKELHAILKAEAEARGMSISGYINELQTSVQSFVTRVSDRKGINTRCDNDGNEKRRKSGLNQNRRTDPAGFEPATPGLEGRCYIHAKPRAQGATSSG